MYRKFFVDLPLYYRLIYKDSVMLLFWKNDMYSALYYYSENSTNSKQENNTLYFITFQEQINQCIYIGQCISISHVVNNIQCTTHVVNNIHSIIVRHELTNTMMWLYYMMYRGVLKKWYWILALVLKSNTTFSILHSRQISWILSGVVYWKSGIGFQH